MHGQSITDRCEVSLTLVPLSTRLGAIAALATWEPLGQLTNAELRPLSAGGVGVAGLIQPHCPSVTPREIAVGDD